MPFWMRVGLPLFLLIQALAFVAIAFVTPFPLSLLFALLAPFIFLVSVFSLSMGALRVSLSPDTLMIQNGLLGPKIPLDMIELCEAVSYEALLEYGGWGVRKGLDGTTVYNVLGDGGKAVRVHYRDAKGKVRKVLFSSAHHDSLVEKIQALRGRASVGSEMDVEVEVEVEAEVEEVEEVKV